MTRVLEHTGAAALGSAREATWDLVLAAAGLAPSLDDHEQLRQFAFAKGTLVPAASDEADAVLEWRPGQGWHSLLSSPPRSAGR